MNPYNIGIGQFVVIGLNVVVLAILWRILSAKLAVSNNPTLSTLGAAMGSTL